MEGVRRVPAASAVAARRYYEMRISTGVRDVFPAPAVHSMSCFTDSIRPGSRYSRIIRAVLCRIRRGSRGTRVSRRGQLRQIRYVQSDPVTLRKSESTCHTDRRLLLRQPPHPPRSAIQLPSLVDWERGTSVPAAGRPRAADRPPVVGTRWAADHHSSSAQQARL
jgi:hypothetical protein